MPFDWSPYFGSYKLSDLVTTAVVGVAALSPVIVMRLGFGVALDVIRSVHSAVSEGRWR